MSYALPTIRRPCVDVTLQVVSSGQNGPGTADTETTYFNTLALPIWKMDGDGFLTYLAYDQCPPSRNTCHFSRLNAQPKTHAWQHSRKAQGCTFFVQCKNLEKIGFSSCNPVAPCLLFEHRRTESHRKVAAIRVLCPRSSGLTQMTRSTESGCSMLHFIFGDRQKIQLCQLRPELIWPVA
jgi:hypothetical protein